MDSTVHRPVSVTPIPAGLTLSAPPKPTCPASGPPPSTPFPSSPSPSAPWLTREVRAGVGRARGRRAPAYPERSVPQPRHGCKPRPP
jgi:hypothetical protein